MSKWSRIETSREIRQWINLGFKIAAGFGVGCAWVETHPEAKLKLEAIGYELKKKLNFKKK